MLRLKGEMLAQNIILDSNLLASCKLAKTILLVADKSQCIKNTLGYLVVKSHSKILLCTELLSGIRTSGGFRILQGAPTLGGMI